MKGFWPDKTFTFKPIATCSDSFCHHCNLHLHLHLHKWKLSHTNSVFDFCRIRITHKWNLHFTMFMKQRPGGRLVESPRAYSIMAVRTIGGIGVVRILNRTPRVELTKIRAVWKMILLQCSTSWLGASGAMTSHVCCYL